MTAPYAVISLENASRWYGDVIGINQVTLDIRPGITGLLGPNGAGKSTLMKLVTGQLKVGGGTVRVDGMDPWRERRVFANLGFCPDTDSFYEPLSGLEFVTVMGRLSGMTGAVARAKAAERLDYVGLAASMNRPLRGYSKGMRQRAKLAAAVIHDPRILILDEPLNGLDVMGRREFLRLFKEFGSEGRTLLVSSHILHEIETLTQEIALIHHGRVLADGRIDEIRSLIENQPLTLEVTASAPRLVGSQLAGLEDVSSVAYSDGGALVVRTKRPEVVYQNLQDGVLEGRYTVDGLTALDDNLDAVFSYLVKE